VLLEGLESSKARFKSEEASLASCQYNICVSSGKTAENNPSKTPVVFAESGSSNFSFDSDTRRFWKGKVLMKTPH
jgi:hypothetical protein